MGAATSTNDALGSLSSAQASPSSNCRHQPEVGKDRTRRRRPPPVWVMRFLQVATGIVTGGASNGTDWKLGFGRKRITTDQESSSEGQTVSLAYSSGSEDFSSTGDQDAVTKGNNTLSIATRYVQGVASALLQRPAARNANANNNDPPQQQQPPPPLSNVFRRRNHSPLKTATSGTKSRDTRKGVSESESVRIGTSNPMQEVDVSSSTARGTTGTSVVRNANVGGNKNMNNKDKKVKVIFEPQEEQQQQYGMSSSSSGGGSLNGGGGSGGAGSRSSSGGRPHFFNKVSPHNNLHYSFSCNARYRDPLESRENPDLLASTFAAHGDTAYGYAPGISQPVLIRRSSSKMLQLQQQTSTNDRLVLEDDEDEEECNARENMYAFATWRMYDRIMQARNARDRMTSSTGGTVVSRPISIQQQQQNGGTGGGIPTAPTPIPEMKPILQKKSSLTTLPIAIGGGTTMAPPPPVMEVNMPSSPDDVDGFPGDEVHKMTTTPHHDDNAGGMFLIDDIDC